MADKPKSIVFIDASNYHYGLQKLGWCINYKKFADWLKQGREIVNIYYYGSSHSEKSFFISHPEYNSYEPSVKFILFGEYKDDRKKFFKILKNLGIIVREKPIWCVYDNTEGKYKLKSNSDVELTVDALDRINDYNEIVLCSGDGDFARLIRYLKNKGKITTIISIKERTSSVLAKATNNLIYLNSLRQEIEFISPKNTESSTCVEPPYSPS
jgi:uncharacterized LabA/DUF88 family protein